MNHINVVPRRTTKSNGGASQHWRVKEIFNGVYEIASSPGPFVIQSVSFEPGDAIQWYPDSGDPGQHWTLGLVGGFTTGRLKLTCVRNGLVLKVPDSAQAGATVVQDSDVGGANQEWRVHVTTPIRRPPT